VKAVAEIVGNAPRGAQGPGGSEGESDDRDPPVIAALARAMPGDIEAAAKSLAPAKRHRIHTFLSTSDIHRRYMLQASEDEILQQAIEAVQLARTYTDDVEFSPQDATRTDFEFLIDIVAAAVEAGATTVNIPDTVGYALPHDFGNWIAEIHRRVPDIEAKGVHVSVHCHNDLGLAVANSIEAVRNGAKQIEVAVNGIGERAGNCSLEEVVMAIRTRADLLGLDHGVYTPELTRTSRLVSSLTGYGVQKNKAVVGENAFAHESGIHQHGVLADRLTYEIMKSEDVGADGSQIVLGKHSGKHAFKKAIDDLGFELEPEEVAAAFTRFKEVADRKGLVGSDDLSAIVISETHVKADDDYHFVSLTVSGAPNPTRPPRCASASTTWRPRAASTSRSAASSPPRPAGTAWSTRPAARSAARSAGTRSPWSRSRCRRSPGGSTPSERSPSPSRSRRVSASLGAGSPPTSSRRARAPTWTR
jgi:2-isopropylmalate synthase